MSSELLSRAAAQMREQHGPEHERHLMWSAMADWLEREAQRPVSYGFTSHDGSPVVISGPSDDAIKVAGAYLGDLAACKTCDDYGVLDSLDPCPDCARPKWADMLGAAPDYTGGVPVDEWLDANRGGA